jgi:muramidase (phage lysozyme)
VPDVLEQLQNLLTAYPQLAQAGGGVPGLGGQQQAPSQMGLLAPQPDQAAPPSVPPEARPFLDAVASGESPAYNIRYDGGKGAVFDSFADHPRQLERITVGPYRGQRSDAAGKYQMISTTWDKVAKPLGLSDFSPESQDMAAWQLANNSYGNLSKGRDLLADLQAGRHDDVARVLSSEWASIARNPQAFVRALRGAYPPPGS